MNKKNAIHVDEGLIRKLAKLLDETGLAEIEYGHDGLSVRVAKPKENLIYSESEKVQETVAFTPKRPDGLSSQEENIKPMGSGTITAPMVGIAYLSPDPDSPPLINIGDKVRANQTLLLIEAMKVFNQIKAPKSGIVSKILIENGSPVEFGEPLIVID